MRQDIVEFHKNPEYEVNQDDWIKYHDLYEGKHEVLIQPQYLWYHEFENSKVGGKELREVRANRTRYTNLIKPFINRFTSMVYRQHLDIAEIEKALGKDVIENIDGKTTDLESFLRNCMAKDHFLFGRFFLIADAFDIQGQLSQQEAIDAGRRPFLDCINPLQVKDWQIDMNPGANFGKLEQFRYEFVKLEPRATLAEKPKLSTYTKIYRLVDGGFEWSLYKLNSRRRGYREIWKLVEPAQIIPGFDELPIVYHIGDSWIADVADIALSHYNAESALDSQLLYQAFQRIIFRGNFKKESNISIHEGTGLFVPGDGDIKVLEPSEPKALERRIDKFLNNMYKVAFNQTRQMPTDSKMIEGADTQRESKVDFLALVVQAAKDQEAQANKAIQKMFNFAGKEDNYDEEKHGLVYDKKITAHDIEQEKELTLAFFNEIRQYPTWKKSVLKKWAGSMNLKELEAIEKEIDELTEELDKKINKGNKKPNPDAAIDKVIDDDIDEDETARSSTTS
jgi:hypothetical protein